MTLNESQIKKVSEWIAEGLKLSEIQKRLSSELDIHPTYMEVRFLVDDLKLTPKDVEPVVTPPAAATAAAPPTGQLGEPAGGAGGVSVSVDQVMRPGAAVSGSVTFSDGNSAVWYIDQLGRPGLIPEQAGYKPSAADLQQFQAALEAELVKLGI